MFLCARIRRRALPLDHEGRSRDQDSPSSPLAQRVIASDAHLPAERRKMENAGCFCSVSRLMLRSRKKYSSACGPHFFASLNSLAVTRTRVTSTGLMQGTTNLHVAPASLGKEPECALVRRLEHNSVGDRGAQLSDLPAGRRTSLFALCPSAFAAGRRFVTLPVFGLRVQLHQPPAQEKQHC